jgi:hypothetical protein
MLRSYSLLFHQVTNIDCIRYLFFFFVTSLLLDVLFVIPDTVLLLFHFKIPLSDVPLKGIRMCQSQSTLLYTGHALFCFPILSLRTLLILFLCVESPFLCHYFRLIVLILVQLCFSFNC